jgi:hypothetical protein
MVFENNERRKVLGPYPFFLNPKFNKFLIGFSYDDMHSDNKFNNLIFLVTMGQNIIYYYNLFYVLFFLLVKCPKVSALKVIYQNTPCVGNKIYNNTQY